MQWSCLGAYARTKMDRTPASNLIVIVDGVIVVEDLFRATTLY